MTAPHLRGVGADSKVEQDLARLHADLAAARSVVHINRRTPRVPGRSSAAEADLLDCLETFTTALRLYRLPVPRRVRDELRLRRLLAVDKER